MQFTVSVVEKRGVKTLQAENICGLGGVPISVQDEVDQKKTFVGGQNLRCLASAKLFVSGVGWHSASGQSSTAARS